MLTLAPLGRLAPVVFVYPLIFANVPPIAGAVLAKSAVLVSAFLKSLTFALLTLTAEPTKFVPVESASP